MLHRCVRSVFQSPCILAHSSQKAKHSYYVYSVFISRALNRGSSVGSADVDVEGAQGEEGVGAESILYCYCYDEFFLLLSGCGRKGMKVKSICKQGAFVPDSFQMQAARVSSSQCPTPSLSPVRAYHPPSPAVMPGIGHSL